MNREPQSKNEPIEMKRLNYLLVYTLPCFVLISLQLKGYATFLTVAVFFGLVPLLELVIPPDPSNVERTQRLQERKKKVYVWILYLLVPVQCGLLLYFFKNIGETPFLSIAYFGKICSMGIACGVLGLNVGHELGHKNHRFVQFLGEVLLLSSLNTHFLPYHNAGHHHLVATKEDPATARRNESVYAFWFRSHFKSYAMAWQLEFKRMKRLQQKNICLGNRMCCYTLWNIALLCAVYFFFGGAVLWGFLGAAVFGILLLETVNYIEHYGLLRKIENERYERVNPSHSWNSDHPVGRLLLFNLSRHSDHHKNARKNYQVLDSHPESPQMPTGYPGMMLLSLVPPLWFRYMNKRLKNSLEL
jgi:alkane 1-monooxygenase